MQKSRRMYKTFCTKLANASNNSTDYLITTEIDPNFKKSSLAVKFTLEHTPAIRYCQTDRQNFVTENL